MSEAKKILSQYWGYQSFRPLQEEIVNSVLAGEPTLALLPTGGGKSICFQVPALMKSGICIVVSPLIALMKDQVEQLNRRGVNAVAIFSGMKRRQIDITLDNCIYGNIKFLYVSPERLKSDLFIERSKKMQIALLAVDEAHCISQWGYDFRPSYLEISSYIEQVAVPNIIALTATATKEVKRDIKEKLKMSDLNVFEKSFARANLSYSVFHLENKFGKLLQILKNVRGSSVVYVRNRKKTSEVADFLRRNQISASHYHGGLDNADRSKRQDSWISGDVRVMVATNAFGMGIDKPDVRTVIHLDVPDTLEAYYQEAGRAGRDEKKAFAVLIYEREDVVALQKRADQNNVSVQFLQRTYQALANYFKIAVGSFSLESHSFDFSEFTKNYDLPVLETYASLKKLENEGLIQSNEGFYARSSVHILLDKGDLYAYQIANPKLDGLIKAILRLYGGEIFTSYIQIKEQDLATILAADIKQVVDWLSYLSNNEILDYQNYTGAPSITFLTPRLDSKSLPIDETKIAERREIALQKVSKIVEYLETSTCRTNFLQTYFDEKPKASCGVCDNDLKMKQNQDSSPRLIDILSLLETPKNLSQLRATIPDYAESRIVEALRALIEEGKIVEKQGVFYLKDV